MKILILSNAGNEIGKNRTHTVNNISAVYGYFFYHNMKKYIEKNKLDIKVYIDKLSYSERTDITFDHCFVLYNRGVKVLGESGYNNLRKHVTGKIFTISPSSKFVGNEDILLHYVGKVKKKCFKIHWMADETVLKPEQTDKIRILVDHEYYGKKDSRLYKNDQTHYIIKSLLKYKESNPDIEIIQINTDCKEGYKVINSLKDVGNYNRRKATSFLNIAKIYNTSSIFVVTHEECMGISTLECNMAGCKLVIPKDYIKKEFVKFLDYVHIKPITYTKHEKVDKSREIDVDWDLILKTLNPEQTRKKVRKLTYLYSIDRIFKKILLKDNSS